MPGSARPDRDTRVMPGGRGKAVGGGGGSHWSNHWPARSTVQVPVRAVAAPPLPSGLYESVRGRPPRDGHDDGEVQNLKSHGENRAFIVNTNIKLDSISSEESESFLAIKHIFYIQCGHPNILQLSKMPRRYQQHHKMKKKAYYSAVVSPLLAPRLFLRLLAWRSALDKRNFL